MLTAKFKSTYPTINKRGEKMSMFVYYVHGTTAELATFEQVQGANYRTDEKSGLPIWHSPTYYGDSVSLIVLEPTADKPARIIADTSDVAKINSLLKVYGNSKVGDALANILAQKLLGSDSAPAPMPEHKPQPTVADDSGLDA